MSVSNSKTPKNQTQPDSDVEVEKSSDFDLQTTENDPSLPASARDPSLQASGGVTDRVVLHNSQTHKPATRLPSMPWTCNVCKRQFQNWQYIPPAASEEQVVVVPASPVEQVDVVPAGPAHALSAGEGLGDTTLLPAAPVEQVDVVPAASVEKAIIPVVPKIIIHVGKKDCVITWHIQLTIIIRKN
jgi:hypothetical protein